jgi:hypothetical protein
MPNTRSRVALVGVLLSAVGATAACIPPQPPGTTTTTVAPTTTVPANLTVDVSPGSTPTGITVHPGQTVTVVGTGFTTTGNLGTRPPFAGQPAGVYVTFGRFADTWKPSAGAPSSARQIIEQQWALPPASYDALGGAAGTVRMTPAGGFSVTLTPSPASGTNPNYGIAVYPGSGALNTAEEIFIPVTLAGS